MKSFFSDGKVAGLISREKQTLESEMFESTKEDRNIDGFLCQLFSSFLSIPEKWDELCQQSIESRGEQILHELELDSRSQTRKARLVYILSTFIFEFDLNNKKLDIGSPVSLYLDDFFSEPSAINPVYINSLHHGAFVAIYYHLKNTVSPETILTLREFKSNFLTASTALDDLEKQVQNREKRLRSIIDELKAAGFGINLRQLSHGFQELVKEKVVSQRVSLFSLLALGLAIISTIVVAGYTAWTNEANLSLAAKGIPTASLVIVLIYFFRVVLQHHKVTRKHVTQIKLKAAFLAFIQEYVDFSSDIRKGDSSTLDRFENMLFSQLGDEGDVAINAFDGIENIVRIIKQSDGK